MTKRPPLAVAAAAAAVAASMLVLDLTWLGVIARGLYDTALGPLKRPEVLMPAAALFYAFYVGAVLIYAVLGATGRASAALRGAGLGLVAYGTYELTNWAVLRDWPAVLVPVDIGWGMLLTASVAWLGKWAFDAVAGRA